MQVMHSNFQYKSPPRQASLSPSLPYFLENVVAYFIANVDLQTVALLPMESGEHLTVCHVLEMLSGAGATDGGRWL